MHIDHPSQNLPTAPGAHTCLLFDSLEDYKDQADKYILDGLQNNKKCICALDEYPVSEMETRLKSWGMDVHALEKNGQLTLRKSCDSYCPGQEFDPEKTYATYTKKPWRLKDRGSKGCRAWASLHSPLETPGQGRSFWNMKT